MGSAPTEWTMLGDSLRHVDELLKKELKRHQEGGKAGCGERNRICALGAGLRGNKNVKLKRRHYKWIGQNRESKSYTRMNLI
jgi:hypothetical protein